MKNLANCISISRIVLSILLLFTELLSPYFFIVFILCGVTDFLDGYIARRYSLDSDFGANLDSFADLIFIFCFLVVLFSQLEIGSWIILWIMCIVLIKIISFSIGFMKFRKISLIHTYLNKMTGVALVFLPFALLFIPSNVVLVFVCLMATLAAFEELIIIISSQNLDLNCGSILKNRN